jgi:hypothetical protein
MPIMLASNRPRSRENPTSTSLFWFLFSGIRISGPPRGSRHRYKHLGPNAVNTYRRRERARFFAVFLQYIGAISGCTFLNDTRIIHPDSGFRDRTTRRHVAPGDINRRKITPRRPLITLRHAICSAIPVFSEADIE